MHERRADAAQLLHLLVRRKANLDHEQGDGNRNHCVGKHLEPECF